MNLRHFDRTEERGEWRNLRFALDEGKNFPNLVVPPVGRNDKFAAFLFESESPDSHDSGWLVSVNAAALRGVLALNFYCNLWRLSTLGGALQRTSAPAT